MVISVRNLSPRPTRALLGIHVCGCVRVCVILQLQDPSLSRKSCRDLPVFSFPLEAFPHTNKAQPAWWNGKEAAFVKGAADWCVCVCVCVHCWPWLTVCYMQIYFWACNSGSSRLVFADEPTVAHEQAYSVSHPANNVASCLPLINW